MVRTKVFVGNLAFQTKEPDLAQVFSKAGKVISANIITRGSRSLGYGFVEMDSEEDANKAVQLMNKQVLDGRPINVEVAKPRDETQDNQPQSSGFRGRGRGRGRGGFRGRGGGRGRGFRGGARGGYRRRFRGNNFGYDRRDSGAKEIQPDNRTPSKTTLFVANLPFKLDDASFAKFVSDQALKFKNAHVVTNQRTNRSKGFGFIEFENEQDQLKALNTLNKKVVEERELVVKIALTENPSTENKQDTLAPAQKQ